MVVYYCTGGVLQSASGHLTLIELLHVHRVREGERVAKASPILASHHAHGRGRRRVVVKSSFTLLYELTQHIIALAPHVCL